MAIRFVINPGSGPVADATEAQAADNMRHFVTDLDLDDVQIIRIPDQDYGDGRYAFLLWRKPGGANFCTPIQMPGRPLAAVRYQEGDDPWQFPRLYVNDSSWLWAFAVNCAVGDLTGQED